jgi:hypothetical protein
VGVCNLQVHTLLVHEQVCQDGQAGEHNEVHDPLVQVYPLGHGFVDEQATQAPL